MSIVILLIAIAPLNLIFAIPVMCGACMGAVLPDIQMKTPPRRNLRILAYCLARFTRRCCVPVIACVYSSVFGLAIDGSDKRVTHSIPGIIGIFLCTGAIVIIPAFLLLPQALFSASLTGFLGGITIGLALHLAGDLCTRKGITPFYPFAPTRVSGSIRPCDKNDCRITHYHAHHGLALIGIPGLVWSGSFPAPAIPSLGIVAMLVCTGTMIFLSDVTIDRRPDDGHASCDVDSCPHRTSGWKVRRYRGEGGETCPHTS
ncbi:MAG: metal-dependent hydrolase [Methanoregulaceae archaeon]|nr:metal-dependent hydrolase [Methanoregulaceae archaeon]